MCVSQVKHALHTMISSPKKESTEFQCITSYNFYLKWLCKEMPKDLKTPKLGDT